jgi:hypothetical protein
MASVASYWPRPVHSLLRPVVSILNRVRYLRSHNAAVDTPLCAVRHPIGWRLISLKIITDTIRVSAAILGRIQCRRRFRRQG